MFGNVWNIFNINKNKILIINIMPKKSVYKKPKKKSSKFKKSVSSGKKNTRRLVSTIHKKTKMRKQPTVMRKQPKTLRKNPLQIYRKPLSMKSMSFQDSKFYSSQSGKKPVFKRRTSGFKNIDGDISGFEFNQDNNQQRLITYPN